MQRIASVAIASVITTLAVAGCQDAPTAPFRATGPNLETTRYFDNYRFTSEYTGYAPCANGGLGEDLSVQIDGHNVVHRVDTDDGQHFMLHDFGQSRGSAVGLTTGERYRLVNVYQQTETGDETRAPFTNAIAYVARLVGESSGVELLYRSLIHATRNANGELIVYFENESYECR